MKKLTIILLTATVFALSSFIASAQDECDLYRSYYTEYYKQGSKDAKMMALPSWRKAYDICAPNKSQNLYIQGADLFRILISKNANNPEYRAALIDTLVTLHKKRAQYYPKYADKAYDALAKDVNNLLKNNPAKTYEILTEVIKIQGAKTAPVAFVANMNATVALYKEGKLSIDEVIGVYDESVKNFTELQKTDTTQITRDLRATMENAFINSKVASCDNLIALFTPRFEENKDDIDQITKMVKLLASVEGCTDNDLYMKSVTRMHQLSPSANSAYYLYRLHASKDNVKDALTYIEEAAASDELDVATKAQYLYEKAAFSLKNGYYAKAVEAAGQSAELDSSLTGKADMIIGHAWMSISCGGNEVEKRAKFWVAVDYFNRARAADASLAEEAGKFIGTCASYFPETAEAFMYDFQNGQSYTVSCNGMRAVTTVRTK